MRYSKESIWLIAPFRGDIPIPHSGFAIRQASVVLMFHAWKKKHMMPQITTEWCGKKRRSRSLWNPPRVSHPSSCCCASPVVTCQLPVRSCFTPSPNGAACVRPVKRTPFHHHHPPPPPPPPLSSSPPLTPSSAAAPTPLADALRGWGVAANRTSRGLVRPRSSGEVNEWSCWAISQTWAAMLRLPQWAWLYYHWALSNYTLPARGREGESIRQRKEKKLPGVTKCQILTKKGEGRLKL